MSGGWVLGVIAAVVVAVGGTLYASLVLVRQCVTALTELFASVTRSMLGVSDPQGGDLVYEEEVGESQGLFQTLPGWQWWGSEEDGEPSVEDPA